MLDDDILLLPPYMRTIHLGNVTLINSNIMRGKKKKRIAVMSLESLFLLPLSGAAAVFVAKHLGPKTATIRTEYCNWRCYEFIFVNFSVFVFLFFIKKCVCLGIAS